MKEYEYKYRVLADSYNCLSTFQYKTMEEAIEKLCQLTMSGYKSSVYPITHNTDPKKAEYEYRNFDITELEATQINGIEVPYQVGMVLYESEMAYPEFHGFRPSVEEALDYIDNYYYEKNKEN